MNKADMEAYREFCSGVDDEEEMNLAKESAEPEDKASLEWERFSEWKRDAGVVRDLLQGRGIKDMFEVSFLPPDPMPEPIANIINTYIPPSRRERDLEFAPPYALRYIDDMRPPGIGETHQVAAQAYRIWPRLY
jgi:hypothetical protein